MRLRSLLVLLLALALGACVGSAELPGTGEPGDDDDASGNDDDDDDDDASDDDDTGPATEFEDMLGFFQLVATIQHPQGRAADGFGYYVLLPEDEERGEEDKYGCEVSLPEDDEERGEEVESLDGGPWAAFLGETPNGNPWEYGMVQEESGGFLLYLADGGNPPSVPPGVLLDFESAGGEDIPPVYLPEGMPTVAPFNLTEPTLAPGEEIIFQEAWAGMPFTWTPGGDEGVEIVIAFFSEDGARTWYISCWVEDDGAFDVPAEHLQQMPQDLTGLTWFRRYEAAWHPETDEHPDIVLRGALQHRFWVLLYGDTDG